MNPRILTTKARLLKHQRCYEAALHAHLDLPVMSLFACCDREGCFRWKSRDLKCAVLPYDMVGVSSVFLGGAQAHYSSAFLDLNDRRCITKGLKRGCSRQQFSQAIRDYRVKPHKMRHKNHVRCLHIILCAIAQIDHFIGYATTPPLLSGMAGQFSQKHVQILKRWADRNRLKSEDLEDCV